MPVFQAETVQNCMQRHECSISTSLEKFSMDGTDPWSFTQFQPPPTSLSTTTSDQPPFHHPNHARLSTNHATLTPLPTTVNIFTPQTSPHLHLRKRRHLCASRGKIRPNGNAAGRCGGLFAVQDVRIQSLGDFHDVRVRGQRSEVKDRGPGRVPRALYKPAQKRRALTV